MPCITSGWRILLLANIIHQLAKGICQLFLRLAMSHCQNTLWTHTHTHEKPCQNKAFITTPTVEFGQKTTKTKQRTKTLWHSACYRLQMQHRCLSHGRAKCSSPCCSLCPCPCCSSACSANPAAAGCCDGLGHLRHVFDVVCRHHTWEQLWLVEMTVDMVHTFKYI